MIQSPLLKTVSKLVHGFGELKDPVPFENSPEFGHIWTLRPSWNQVHGNSWAEVHSPHQNLGDVDALFTHKTRLPLSVRTADCQPILAVNPNSKTIVAIHAGWRGVASGIVPNIMSALAPRPEEWKVAIGPHIRACCFEVGADVFEVFKNRPEGRAIGAPSTHVDLTAITIADLSKLGITQIDDLNLCTRCSKDNEGQFRFCSYRRDRSQTRQMSTVFFLE